MSPIDLTRTERKLLLPIDRAHQVEHALSAEGFGRTEHLATTYYLETADGAVARRCIEGIDVKARVREYGSTGGLEGDPTPPPASSCWLEVKQRDGSRAHKQRQKVARVDIPEVMRQLGSGYVWAGAEPDLADHLVALVAAVGPMSPRHAVRYRRIAWTAGPARLTLDRNVSFHAIDATALNPDRSCQSERLPPPSCVETRGVLEIKTSGAWPTWLAEALARAGVGHDEVWSTYSKFIEASRRAE